MVEPFGAMPVIIEDDVFIGRYSGIFENTIVKQRAVIAAGVIITGSAPIYDLVKEKIYQRTNESPLIIPEGAVIVPGTRALDSNFAQQHHLTLSTPIIIKYRDSKKDAATVLEESLR
jgi:2,3,4,5-tetrahydropyridine-2-carboxylate N-succinyltransferase